MDWCEWFGFEFDPFFDKPLESNQELKDLLIIEKKMEEQISPLIRQMKKVPFLSLVTGERGVGKSTFMYFSINLTEKAGYVPIYVALDHTRLEFSGRPTYEITASLMYEIGAKLLDSVVNLKPSFFSENRHLLLNLARYLGLSFQESEGFIPSGEPYRLDFFELKRYILTILGLLRRAGTPILLAIDNLDKVQRLEDLETFFTGPVAQSFFDELKNEGVSILIAMAPLFLQLRKKKSSLSYLTQTISIEPLSPPQVKELLTKRVNYSNDPPPSNPFDDKAMIFIGVSRKGITRSILTEARNICVKAYRQDLSKIPEEFVMKGLVSFDESRTFYGILDRNENLKPVALKLCELAVAPEITTEQAVSAIKNLKIGEKIKVGGELLKALIDLGIIESKRAGKFNLTASMASLLDAVEKSNWEVAEFLHWLFAKDSIKLLASGIPGLSARHVIDRFGPIPGVSKATIDIVVGNTQQTVQTQKLHEEAVYELQEAKQIVSHVGALTWDNIDSVSTYREIYRALVTFLIAFSKLYIGCASSKVIKVKSLKASDLIENAIHHFQEEHGVSFKSFYRYLHFKANINGLIRGGFSPSHSDIKAAFDDFVQIVTEFTGIWQSISRSFATLYAPDQRHGLTLKEATKCAILMGYSIDRPEYKRFRIDGEKYFKLGFSDFILDEASVDVVRERRIRNRFDQIQSYFFISSVNPDSKRRANSTEVLAFIYKCNDLMDIIKEENPEMLEGWPKYFLLYFSASGFERGISAALKSAIIPPEAYAKTVDYPGLENLIRQLRAPKRLPRGEISEKEVDKIRKSDLEYLLRLRLSISNVIHEQFEKTTTIFLADMKDFTQRTALDPLESAEAVQKMSDILKANVEKYGGWGANTEGDSFIATFDRPDQAALAALKSIKELQEYNKKVAEKRRIFVRIGISSGEIILKSGRPFIGDAVNIAARIMKEAKPNQVVTEENTHKQISFYRNFKFGIMDAKKLKGIDKPVQIYEIEQKEM
jgi:class 3 adenylate cyclase